MGVKCDLLEKLENTHLMTKTGSTLTLEGSSYLEKIIGHQDSSIALWKEYLRLLLEQKRLSLLSRGIVLSYSF